MRISFFIGSMGSGGAERVISILANGFVQRGYVVDICCLLSDDVDYNLDPHIKLVNMSRSGKSYTKNIVWWVKTIRNFVKKEKPDCIISFVGRINALVLTALVGVPIPIIVSERNDPRADGRGKLMLLYCNLIYQLKAAIIVFQTKYQQNFFSETLNEKSLIVENPVKFKLTTPERVSYTQVVSVGRLTEQKNQKMLIDAIVQVKKKIPEIECRIFGDGELKDELRKQVADSDGAGYIKLMGNRKNVHELMRESGVFVLTSMYEGMSNALIEAMMLGKVCVVTNYPGASEVIEDGVNGYIIPLNDVNALAKKIEIVAKNEFGDNATIQKNALNSAKKYSSKVVIEKWNRIVINQTIKRQ